ncbi:hypothetical protein ONJ16_26430, partial [Salmonella enterica subsp. enterica serovar Montevideo]|nr:hypothetical protein [Salmonella enterica subsp. enterica serovar Montevideo]
MASCLTSRLSDVKRPTFTSDHKTAPVSLRERVTFSPDTLDQALDSLLAQPMVQGGVVLSTC